MRIVLAHTSKASKSVVAAALRTILAQPNKAAASQQLREVVKAMASRWPRAAEVVARAEQNVLAYMTFPAEHWTRRPISDAGQRRAGPLSSLHEASRPSRRGLRRRSSA